jgi:hypothetical protein
MHPPGVHTMYPPLTEVIPSRSNRHCFHFDIPTETCYRVWFGWLVYSFCSHLEHSASVRRFVSLQFLNLRHSVGFLERVISPSQGRYLYTNTDTHASIGIPTHDPSVRASKDSSCLRPRDHWKQKFPPNDLYYNNTIIYLMDILCILKKNNKGTSFPRTE